MSEVRIVGTVKWFDARKGYGFLLTPEGAEVFVHYSQIISDQPYKTLDERRRYEFTPVRTEKGLQAKDVRGTA